MIASHKLLASSGKNEIIEEIEGVVQFVSETDMTITPYYSNTGITLQYSIDEGSNWETIASSGTATVSSKKIWFRGSATGTKALYLVSGSTPWSFTGASDLKVVGNLNHLLSDTLGSLIAPTILADYAFTKMFYGCSTLVTPPSLPATTIGAYAYKEMFFACSNLISPPSLPATTINEYCYYAMFRNCYKLSKLPKLPAGTLANYCYYQMFKNCYQIKVSSSVVVEGSYVYAWKIPYVVTGTEATSWNTSMLDGTTGTFSSPPNINNIYYLQQQSV